MQLFNGDCLEIMKDISNNSVDLLFCDLPYGQTSCKWDCLIDLDLFWKQINRICKDDCPMFFTCSTKFGVSLINSNPKNFRYDLVWVKSSPCGFLNAKKMPMKKHEMVYVFYKKLPKVYTECIAEHHTHKFIKEGKSTTGDKGNECYGKFSFYNNGEKGYDPPLPTSVIRNDGGCKSMYGEEKGKIFIYDEKGKLRNSEPRYEPPLPTSVIGEKSQISTLKKKGINNLYGDMEGGTIGNVHGSNYAPPLPSSILEVKSEKGKHATQKPVDLIKWCLKYYSREGDVVLDPTMGSGSTGVACKNLNRQFIGIELDPEIFGLYPYEFITDKDSEGDSYSLLSSSRNGNDDCHVSVGKFSSKRQIQDNPESEEIYCKYYKFTTTTLQ